VADPKLPTFAELLDRAVLSPQERLELMLRYRCDPLGAGWKIAGIITGQAIACRLAADSEAS
jgi:hypothetical protein